MWVRVLPDAPISMMRKGERVNTVHTDLTARFEAFDAENPQVYDLFKQFSFELIATGKKKSSAWLIANRLRWETAIKTTGDDFKIRKFMRNYPIYHGFFVTKPMKRA